MFSVKHRTICIWVLVAFGVVNVAPSNKSFNKHNKIEQVEENFNEVEKNLGKLKQVVLEDVDSKEVSNDQVCICVQHYLCNPKTGEIVKDGRSLLETRFSENPCPSGFVCCEQEDIAISSKILTVPNSNNFQCGYGDVKEQEISDNDPSLSKLGEFPWTVTIFQTLSSGAEEYQCVGSLINPEVILTAAHCINTTENAIVRAGKWDMLKSTSQGAYVKRIIKHPKFRADNLVYDAALVIIDPPFDITDNINTVCLTNSAPGPLITHSHECLTTGWGRDQPNKQFSKVMKKIGFSLISHDECQQTFRTTRLGQWFELHQSFICGQGQNGLDVCKGFGGAPLICPISKQQKRYQQVGVTSWGIGCAEGPAVFTKISQIKDWIDQEFDTLNITKDYYTYE